MFDLFLATSITLNPVQIIAQSATVYLPVFTTQSSQKDCVTYTVTNTTSKSVRNLYVNRRDSEGNIFKYPLASILKYGILKSGEKASFDMCDNSFVNVEAKQ